MTSRLAVVVIDATDTRLLANFWTQVLGWVILDVEENDRGVDIEIGPEDGSWPTIDLLTVPEAKSVKNRLHLDLRADGTTTEAEIARIESLGATRVNVGQSPDVSWTVLADPEGNEFCVLDRPCGTSTADPIM